MRNRIMLAALLVVSLLCVMGFARQAREARTRWEYTTSCGNKDINKLGEEGWELVTAAEDGHVVCLYFKRQK